MARTRHITRDNMLQNVMRVQREIAADTLARGEALRLLEEAVHVIVRQENFRRLAKRAAEITAAAADDRILTEA